MLHGDVSRAAVCHSFVIGSRKRYHFMLIISDNFQVTITQRRQKPWALLLVYGHRSPSTKESFESVVMCD